MASKPRRAMGSPQRLKSSTLGSWETRNSTASPSPRAPINSSNIININTPASTANKQPRFLLEFKTQDPKIKILESQKHMKSSSSNLIKQLSTSQSMANERHFRWLPAALAVAILVLVLGASVSNSTMCQHHQALLDLAAKATGLPQSPLSQQQQQQLQQQQHQQQMKAHQQNTQNLVVCPKSSQFNNLPQFPPVAVSPKVERQQRILLSHLNASLASHTSGLPVDASNGHPSIDSLIDDELLNEIVSPLVLDAAYLSAKELIVKRRKLENELARQGFVTDMTKSTAVARHQQVTTTTSKGNELEKQQEVFEEMSRILARNLTNMLRVKPASQDMDSFESADSMQLLSRIDLHSSEARHAVSRCEEDAAINCDPNFPYRHADGRCNNLEHPTWGKANTCFARLLPAEYSDGQSAPRISVTGNPLPNPRILSAIVHRDFNYPATYTHFVMQYGQFFAHDIAFTPSSRTKNGQMIQCCPIERDSHPQCFPILVPPDDPFYSNWEESCLNFVRTAVCPRCRLGPREQMNQITSFIDGSQVYGAAANETAALWTKSGPAGRMHVSLDDAGRELLPHSADPSNDQCSDVEKRQFCYRAGDRRVNQHPALTAVHVMWLRQHNRVVNALKMLNPHWNGDRLYQESKRICGAQMQMVTYNEWLSLIIGQDAMKFLKLNVLQTGYTKYDPSVDPSLLNEFSGAAFRFGHSMINNIFAEILPDGRPSGYRLNEFFFHPFGLKSGQHDMVMRGLISQASQNRDPFVSSDIKNHLYRPRDNPYGLDLPAFNIQRGRDHGIPGYTKLVEFCFDDVITNWKQLDQYMPVSQRIRFSKLYRSVHDLDLFSAGLAEYPLPGAALGPTFTCIVGIQMFNLKYGDRFWFEHGGQSGSFTPDQLQEIRKTNLARLICANSDNINIIQRNVFRGESPSNPSVMCNSLPDTDLKAWIEQPGTTSQFTSAIDEAQRHDYDMKMQRARLENNPNRRRRRMNQRPKQEPLAYAFRATPKIRPKEVFTNSYSIVQEHPNPSTNYQQHQDQLNHNTQSNSYNNPIHNDDNNNNNNNDYNIRNHNENQNHRKQGDHNTNNNNHHNGQSQFAQQQNFIKPDIGPQPAPLYEVPRQVLLMDHHQTDWLPISMMQQHQGQQQPAKNDVSPAMTYNGVMQRSR